MGGTVSTTSDNGDGVTPLIRGLRIDEDADSRHCPHECHGSLELIEEDSPGPPTVVCGACRCTPDGVYLPPKWPHEDNGGSNSEESETAENAERGSANRPSSQAKTNENNRTEWLIEGYCSQNIWFYPKGVHPETVPATRSPSVETEYDGKPVRYRHSKDVILPGGHEDVYNEDEEIRPAGVSDEYTFDLTTY